MKPPFDETARVLQVRDLSLAQYFLMCTAWYRMNLRPARFISISLSGAEGDPRGTPSEGTLQKGFEELLDRSLLIVVDEGLLRRERLRRASSEIPEVAEPYSVGEIDFSEEGYFLHKGVLLELYGDAAAEHHEGYFINEDEAGMVLDIFAYKSSACDQARRDNSDHHEVAAWNPPRPMGTWKPNRFDSLDRGFVAQLRFAP